MAFNVLNNSGSTSSYEKAGGFINLYLPDAATGKVKKLGAIPLKVSSEAEKGLLDWLNADPSRVQKLLARLTVDYHEVKTGAAAGFKLD